MDNCRDIAETAIAELADAFAPNELAYLLLTSKSETAIRDRLAFILHRTLDGANRRVVREWVSHPRVPGRPGKKLTSRRLDIAVVQDQHPMLGIEVKAMLDFDAFNANWKRYLRWIREDLRKLRAVAGLHQLPEANGFSLLMATRFGRKPGDELAAVVKYRDWVHESPIAADALDHQVGLGLAEFAVRKQPTLNAGAAFGIEVWLHCWLISTKEVR